MKIKHHHKTITNNISFNGLYIYNMRNFKKKKKRRKKERP